MRRVGLRTLSSYLPRARVETRDILRHWTGSAGGVRSKTVPGFDEDPVTMAWQAAVRALDAAGLSAGDLGLLVLATTSSPYAEHSAATEVARALDVPRSADVIDIGGTVRGGLQALRLAADAVAGGRVSHALVLAADARRAAVGTRLEPLLGAGAAAGVVSADEPGLCLGAWGSHRVGVPVQWRPDGDRMIQSVDDPRFEREYGFLPAVSEAARGALEQAGLAPMEVRFAALNPPAARLGQQAARRLNLAAEVRVADDLLVGYGDLGSAGPLVGLERLWRQAAPGEWGVCVAYASGSGADAMLAQVERPFEGVAPDAVPDTIGYVEYLQRLGLLAGPSLADPPTPYASTPAMLREEEFTTALHGQRCLACGSVNFPERQLCIDCAGHQFETVRLPRFGTVVTHNQQYIVAVSPEPVPVAVGVARLDGLGGVRGGQVSAMFTDTPAEQVRIGARVELVLRRTGVESGLVKYGWKFRGLEERA